MTYFYLCLRHSPHGECGLKLDYYNYQKSLILSLSTRRVWIEILLNIDASEFSNSHSPHGECGLKFFRSLTNMAKGVRHSPHGECGLKWLFTRMLYTQRIVTLHTESVD